MRMRHRDGNVVEERLKFTIITKRTKDWIELVEMYLSINDAKYLVDLLSVGKNPIYELIDSTLKEPPTLDITADYLWISR